jgi:hypothetical protein
MSTEQTVTTSGVTTETTTPVETPVETTVPKAHADKILGEKKKLQENFNQLKAKLDQIEQENLQKSGEHQKLAEKYKSELETERANAQALKKSIVQSNVKGALKEKAKESGLSMEFEDFTKLVNFSEINVDEETGEVVTQDVDKVVTGMKTKYPYLFKKEVITPNNLPTNPNKAGEQKALHELSDAELAELLRKTK